MTKCIGCGAILQNTNPEKEGYTKTLEKELCERCFKIRHYNEYNFIDKSNDYYIEILNKIESTNDLILLVTDFLNLYSIKDLKLKNKTILVLSKRDLTPRNIDENRLLNNIKTNLNVVDKITICTKNNYNLDELYAKINKHKNSKNVYVIGYTSAGKSTMINSFIKNYGNKENYITTSILPSTTLDVLEVPINNDLTLIDTPGLLDSGSAILLKDKIISKIMPKKEIRPITIQAKVDQTLIIENILRLDIKKDANLTFYISNNLKIDRYYKETERLSNLKHHSLNINANEILVIKGLGYIKVNKQSNIKLYLKEEIKYTIYDSII